MTDGRLDTVGRLTLDHRSLQLTSNELIAPSTLQIRPIHRISSRHNAAAAPLYRATSDTRTGWRAQAGASTLLIYHGDIDLMLTSSGADRLKLETVEP